jgi:hypothetical protein
MSTSFVVGGRKGGGSTLTLRPGLRRAIGNNY